MVDGALRQSSKMNKEYWPMLAALADKPFDSEECVYETSNSSSKTWMLGADIDDAEE